MRLQELVENPCRRRREKKEKRSGWRLSGRLPVAGSGQDWWIDSLDFGEAEAVGVSAGLLLPALNGEIGRAEMLAPRI